ncbi:hypothetical protein Golob_012834 [Gossypium lobatum]|uniref:Uncharacterized protein n=1 Tax=Gossypium lobatum TaxID=34289 RepID=A0A7J8LMI5_9ROSI|nr:hypothetical protein [Gossypium lobatum]
MLVLVVVVVVVTYKVQKNYDVNKNNSLSSSFSSDDIDVRERLKRLLDVISDVTELNTASNLDGLKIVELLNGLCSSINGMVSSFVKVLHTPISYSLLLDIVDM